MKEKSPQYRTYLKLNQSLGYFERLQVSDPDRSLSHPVVFILGSPRCGSTLFYQSLITLFDFSYISNLHCRLFGAPWLIEKMFDARNAYTNQPSYTSRFGQTSGKFAPSECGEFWYRFFREQPQYTALEDVTEKDMKRLRTALHAFINAANAPLLIKNLPCALRLQPLVKFLPEALFLILERDEKAIAHSILEARKKLYGNYETWFSLEPPGYQNLREYPPEIQAVQQVRMIYDLIDSSEKDCPARFLHVSYDDFCTNPAETIDRLTEFFENHEVRVQKTGSIPARFETRSEIRIPKEMYHQLTDYIRENPVT